MFVGGEMFAGVARSYVGMGFCRSGPWPRIGVWVRGHGPLLRAAIRQVI